MQKTACLCIYVKYFLMLTYLIFYVNTHYVNSQHIFSHRRESISSRKDLVNRTRKDFIADRVLQIGADILIQTEYIIR